jgi:peptide/nickel transport system ATP-binding protein
LSYFYRVTEKDILLEVRDLRTHFHTDEGTVEAIKGVNFTLHRGETLGIVGESGSGKSVTALSIMRLIPVPTGEIVTGEIIYHQKLKDPENLLTIEEQDMRSFRGNEISMIFQEPMTSLNPVFTCGNQVMEAIMLHQNVTKSRAKTMAMDLFDKVKLADPERVLKSYPHQLSGGQKQRVMIAMAMSCNPGILIADEPTTALDVTVQKAILDLMSELSREIDMSVIFITHDLGVIAEIADRVLVMYKGKVVEEGTIFDIFSNPQHPYTKGLLACRPPLDKRLRKLPVISDFMEIEDGEAVEKKASISGVMDKLIVTDTQQKQRLADLLELKPMVEVRNLKTYFPTSRNFLGKPKSFVKAVDDVSFDVHPGETLGLVGESGCGKTTLGRTILRLVEPYSGSVNINGVDVTKLNKNQLKDIRRNMQIIFQDPYSSLNPRLTIGNAIMEPMRVHQIYESDEERKEKVMELLDKVNMEADHYNRYPHEFSGGQRQRICIARALALNPKFIICDESVSALDVSVQAQVLNLLLRLREEFGFTYIFISHDLSVVKFMSDRMIVMNSGKIEEMGPSESIYHDPQEEYTKKLIKAIPKGRLRDIKLRLERQAALS